MGGEEGAAAAAAEAEVIAEAVEEDVEGGVGAGAECKGGGGNVTLCVLGGGQGRNVRPEAERGGGGREGRIRAESVSDTKIASVRYGAQKF